MRKTGFLFDRRYLLHETGAYHPEVPARLEAVYKGIEEGGLRHGAFRQVASRWRQRIGDAGSAG